MKIKKFWRLSPSAIPSLQAIFDAPQLRGPVELLAHLSPHAGIVFARWDAAEELGMVSALGIVRIVSMGQAKVDWREVDFSLRPNPAGRHHWANKHYFAFPKDVAERYGLADLFADRFDLLEDIQPSTTNQTLTVPRRLPTSTTAGYVYVIRSQYGFKIGKTVNIRTRTRLFEVKLPFPISIEHYAWFEDYTSAERNFHQMFRDKRLEGERFNLSPQDINVIKGFGKAA